MTLAYAVESWEQYRQDAEVLWPEHWREIANNQDLIPLVCDYDRYAELEAKGLLHIVTVRDDGRLVGYWVGLVMPGHLHYATTPHAHMDVLWVHQAWRKGLVGYRLLQCVERTIQQRVGGLVKLVMGMKTHYDLGALYTRLGYTEIERNYAKMLKGA